jgi:adenine/guanine phosphoribosyltransferase-like PRPP-binding protein
MIRRSQCVIVLLLCFFCRPLMSDDKLVQFASKIDRLNRKGANPCLNQSCPKQLLSWWRANDKGAVIFSDVDPDLMCRKESEKHESELQQTPSSDFESQLRSSLGPDYEPPNFSLSSAGCSTRDRLSGFGQREHNQSISNFYLADSELQKYIGVLLESESRLKGLLGNGTNSAAVNCEGLASKNLQLKCQNLSKCGVPSRLESLIDRAPGQLQLLESIDRSLGELSASKDPASVSNYEKLSTARNRIIQNSPWLENPKVLMAVRREPLNRQQLLTSMKEYFGAQLEVVNRSLKQMNEAHICIRQANPDDSACANVQETLGSMPDVGLALNVPKSVTDNVYNSSASHLRSSQCRLRKRNVKSKLNDERTVQAAEVMLTVSSFAVPGSGIGLRAGWGLMRQAVATKALPSAIRGTIGRRLLTVAAISAVNNYQSYKSDVDSVKSSCEQDLGKVVFADMNFSVAGDGPACKKWQTVQTSYSDRTMDCAIDSALTIAPYLIPFAPKLMKFVPASVEAAAKSYAATVANSAKSLVDRVNGLTLNTRERLTKAVQLRIQTLRQKYSGLPLAERIQRVQNLISDSSELAALAAKCVSPKAATAHLLSLTLLSPAIAADRPPHWLNADVCLNLEFDFLQSEGVKTLEKISVGDVLLDRTRGKLQILELDPSGKWYKYKTIPEGQEAKQFVITGQKFLAAEVNSEAAHALTRIRALESYRPEGLALHLIMDSLRPQLERDRLKPMGKQWMDKVLAGTTIQDLSLEKQFLELQKAVGGGPNRNDNKISYEDAKAALLAISNLAKDEGGVDLVRLAIMRKQARNNQSWSSKGTNTNVNGTLNLTHLSMTNRSRSPPGLGGFVELMPEDVDAFYTEWFWKEGMDSLTADLPEVGGRIRNSMNIHLGEYVPVKQREAEAAAKWSEDIVQLKKTPSAAAAKALLSQQSEAIEQLKGKYDLVISVPSRTGDVDASRALASAVAEKLGLDFAPDLVRRVPGATKEQKQLSFRQRLDNAANSFRVRGTPTKLMRKRVLIVDDVGTTGATLEAIKQQLFDEGIFSQGLVLGKTTP